VRGSGQDLKPIHQILGNIENYYGGHTAFRFYTYAVETAVFYAEWSSDCYCASRSKQQIAAAASSNH
jgi:hypothetical protein